MCSEVLFLPAHPSVLARAGLIHGSSFPVHGSSSLVLLTQRSPAVPSAVGTAVWHLALTVLHHKLPGSKC